MITAAYIDAPLVVCEYLQLESSAYGDNPLSEFIESRVYVDSGPKTLPAAAFIVVRENTSRQRAAAPISQPRVQLDIYSATDAPQGARDLALRTAFWLHRARSVETESGVLLAAVHTGGGEPIAMPANTRPFIPMYFQVQVKPKE